jgi:NitT/TauT family transport system substrate-binding protein
MKMKPVHLLTSLSLVLILLLSANPNVAQTPAATAAANPPGSMTKIKLGYSVWVGYGPLFIARDKGYFTDAGLDVELVKVEDPKDRFTALAGSQLDGLVSTLDTMAQYWKAETPFHAILGLDESSGGDGIVANAGINTVKDLKGKQVGVNVGSVSQFFLEYILQQNGMSASDMTLVKMKQGDVPAALAANRIDAGVTWEPHLSKSVKNGAKLIANSKETPGLIVDILILRDDVLKQNPAVAKGLVSAWIKAIDYWKANEEDADTIMAKGLGSFYETAADIKADLAGATLFDADHNQTFFTGTGKGTATATLQFAIDFYTKLGIITTPVKAADMIDPTYVVPAGSSPAATMAATAAK